MILQNERIWIRQLGQIPSVERFRIRREAALDVDESMN